MIVIVLVWRNYKVGSTCDRVYLLPVDFLDVDECLLGTDDCHGEAACINTVGRFNCSCNTGYDGDGKNCTSNVVALLPFLCLQTCCCRYQ